MSANERSVFDILCDSAGNVEGILRAEIHLLATAIREDIRASQWAVGLIGVGIVSAIFAAFSAIVALVYALSSVLSVWAAALLVAFALALCAATMVTAGSRHLRKLMASMKVKARFKDSLE